MTLKKLGPCFILNFLLSLFYCNAIASFNDCKDIDFDAGKLTALANGKVLINGQPLLNEKFNGLTSGKFGNATGNTTFYYKFLVSRNKKNQPTEIFSTLDSFSVDGKNLLPWNEVQTNKVTLEYDETGCKVSRLIKEDSVVFDRKICEKLSGLFSKFSEDQIAACDQIVRDMSKTIESYKNSISSQGLHLSSETGNPYGSAIAYSSECAVNLYNKHSTNKSSISVRSSKAAR
ncbi:MAG: hypothetical protein ACXVCP_00630 [Bdellovibrio sp.]